jgi:uncharacterized protein YggE
MKILVAAGSLLFLVARVFASPLPDYPFVFAEGESRAELRPDIVNVAYRVKVFASTASNAAAIVEQRTAYTLAILTDNGVARDDITAFEVEKDLIRKGQKDDFYAYTESLEVIGYSMTRRVRFTLRDLKKYEAVITSLLKAPNAVNLGVKFDRTDREEIENRLLSQAVENAVEKAQRIATSAQSKVRQLRAISQTGFGGLGSLLGVGSRWGSSTFSRADRPPAEELLFVPSSIEFASSVSVIFELGGE